MTNTYRYTHTRAMRLIKALPTCIAENVIHLKRILTKFIYYRQQLRMASKKRFESVKRGKTTIERPSLVRMLFEIMKLLTFLSAKPHITYFIHHYRKAIFVGF